MYIIKNALRCIVRSKGRNILIGIIALVIAVSACIGLSIRQASESAKTEALDGMTITASISYDRSSMMNQMGGGRGQGGGMGGFDRDQFASMMGSASTSLTLDQHKIYAAASTVQDFYYTLTAYFNGTENFSPVTDEPEEETNSEITDSFDGMGGMFGGGMSFPGGMGFSSGDFTLVGYSSDSAMLDFVNGTATILEGGSMFEEGTGEYVCVISEELAIFNDLSVGDTIVISNPSVEDETYTLTISGIYKSSSANDFSMSMFGASQDPANKIYLSATALQSILNATEAFHEFGYLLSAEE